VERIGVLGLGRMGTALALRLAGQGAEVAGWTRSGRRAAGIAAATDPGAVAARSDVLILSLFDDAAVAETLDRLSEHDLAGRLILDMSTVAPGVMRSRARALEARGAQLADAPVSGGPEMVAAGTCGIFLGAEGETAARALSVLGLVTDRAVHVGPLGAGMVMKTINNSMIQAYVAGLREMLPLARRAGIPLADALAILNAGPAGLPMVRDRTDRILGRDTSVGFPLSGIVKDNEVFRRVVEDHGLNAPVLTIAGEAHREAVENGLGDLDPAALIARAYREG
jgi:3-hydroxyisobutyrate dehydrogenase